MMRYDRLPFSRYLRFLLQYRVILLAFIMALVLGATFWVKNDFSRHDNQLWINGSKAHNELIKQKYPSYCVNKIDVDISQRKLSPETIGDLREFLKTLQSVDHVKEVHSFFGHKNVRNEKLSQVQQMLEITALEDLSDEEVFRTLERDTALYDKYIDDERVSFYVLSTQSDNFSVIDTPLEYVINNSFVDQYFNEVVLFTILMSVLVILFTIAFKSLLPSLLGGIFIYSTGILTIAAYQMISNVSLMHISIVLVAMTISVMDFTYMYYKWHVHQRKFDSKFVLNRVVSKTISPIFWTSVISVVGIGSLIFVESNILYAIGLNVLLSAISGFVLSFTMLPMLFSFFSQKDPKLITKNTSHFFASLEAHYSKKGLNFFMVLTVGVIIYALFSYFNKPIEVGSNINNFQIKAVLDRKGFDHEQLMELRWIETELKEEFDTIEQITSAATLIQEIHEQESPNEPFILNEDTIDGYLFTIDLYGLKESLMENGALSLYIDLNNESSKTEVLHFLQDKGLIFQDTSSLLSLAKIESIDTLWSVVFFVLFLIFMVIYRLTKLIEFAFIALIVNIIPLAWFFASIHFFGIVMSSEVLVAMIVTVALSSDATLHFIHYYHDHRRKPRSAERALEASFLYIGTPLGMGNIILALTFATLIFVPIDFISNIGLYSSMLIALSLLTDLFILPILFLKSIKANKLIEDYDHTL